MASKQFDHLQESSLKRLQALIPHDCPLFVLRAVPSGFLVRTLDERDSCTGRYQLVASWIAGYVASWKRVRRVVSSGVPPTDAVSRTQLPSGRVRYPGIVDTR